MTDATILSHVTTAAMVVYTIQLLKRLGWYQRFAAWVPVSDGTVHRLVAIVGAFVASVGIHIATTGSAADGWHVAITIPPVAILLHGLWDWANQFAIQQLAFDTVVSKTTPSVPSGPGYMPTPVPAPVPVPDVGQPVH